MAINSVVVFSINQSQGKLLIRDSLGESCFTNEFGKILDFMLEEYDDDVSTYARFVYDLDRFVNILYSAFKLDGDKERLIYPPYKLFYVPNKVFGISRKYKEKVKGNFYQEKIAEANLYDLKQYYPDAKPTNLDEVVELGRDLLINLQRMGLNPTKFSSPVAIYDECMLRHMSIFPLACHVPSKAHEALEYALQIMNREWRCVYKVGHWKEHECFDYDLTSAYPSIMAEIPDIRYAKWLKLTSLSDSAWDWGIMRGKLKIAKDVTPWMKVGEWDDIITTDDLALINKWGLGEFKMVDGWFANWGVKGMPFDNIMRRLFGLRATGEAISRLSKAISVGVGGKFREIHDDGSYGDYFNPIYGCMITDRCALKVANYIYKNELQSSLISVMVDGCLAEKSVATRKDKLFGQWRINLPSPALVISTGYQFMHGKSPTGVTYDEIMAEIEAHPNRTSYCGVSLQLLDEYEREFDKLPKTGLQLMGKIYISKAREAIT